MKKKFCIFAVENHQIIVSKDKVSTVKRWLDS